MTMAAAKRSSYVLKKGGQTGRSAYTG